MDIIDEVRKERVCRRRGIVFTDATENALKRLLCEQLVDAQYYAWELNRRDPAIVDSIKKEFPIDDSYLSGEEPVG